jgi:hypothetical protein
MFHVSLLESYHTSTIPRRIHDPSSPIEVNGEYELVDILDSRISNCQLQYLVHWHEYDASKCTWEPIQNLSNTMERVHKSYR